MIIVKFPRQMYSTTDIARLLAASSLPNFGAAKCSDWLAQQGIGLDQIIGNFLEIRIEAVNIRASHYWRRKNTITLEPVPASMAVDVQSRVPSRRRSERQLAEARA